MRMSKKVLSFFLVLLLVCQTVFIAFAESTSPQFVEMNTTVPIESTVDNSERDFYERLELEKVNAVSSTSDVESILENTDVIMRAIPGAEVTVAFPESTSATGSKTVTIGDLLTVSSVTVNTGKVTYSVSGNNVTVNVSGGTPRVQTGTTKVVSKIVESASNSFSSTYAYKEGGFTGTLSKSGSSSSFVKTPATSKTATATHENTVTSTGTYTPSKTTSTSQSSPAPATKSYNSGGYVGTLTRTSKTDILSDVTTKTGTNTWKRVAKYRANYSGTVTKPAVNWYKQNYTGTVTGVPTNYYKYTVTISYIAKPSAPNVSMTKPANNEKYALGYAIPIVGNGQNNHHINAFVNGVAVLGTQNSNTYSASYTPATAGNYTFQLKGRNTASASDPGSILAVSNTAAIQVVSVGNPTISLDTSKTPIAGESYVIQAKSTNCHHIALYVDKNFIKTVNGNSIGFDYIFPSAGNHTIELRARNADSDVIGSTAITTGIITINVVSPASPSIQTTAPEDGTRIAVGSTVNLTSTALNTKYMQILVDGSQVATSSTGSISKSLTMNTAKTVKVEFIAHNMADAGAVGHQSVSRVIYLNIVNQLDDYPNTVDTAYLITMQSGKNYQQDGILEVSNDEDAFKFVAKDSGDYTFTSSDDVDIRFYEVKSGGGSVPYMVPQLESLGGDTVSEESKDDSGNILLFDTIEQSPEDYNVETPESTNAEVQTVQAAASTGFTIVKNLKLGQTYAIVVYTEADRMVNYRVTLQPPLSQEDQEKLQLIGRMRATLINKPIAGFSIGSTETNYSVAVNTFLSWHEARYQGQYVKGVYKILDTDWRLEVLDHWITLHEHNATQSEFASDRMPDSFYDNIPDLPRESVMAYPSLMRVAAYTEEITRFNKYEAMDAEAYFRDYYFPYYAFNEVYVFNASVSDLNELVNAKYRLWALMAYGPNDEEARDEALVGFMYGMPAGALQANLDAIQVVFQLPQLAGAMKQLLVAMAKGEITHKEIYESISEGVIGFMNEYGEADAGRRGFMIGKMTSQVIISLIEGAGLIRSIKDGSLKLALKVAGKSLAQSLKSLTTKLANSAEAVFELVKKVVKQTDGSYKITTVTNDLIEITEDVLKSDLISAGKTAEEAESALKCLSEGCFSGETLVSTLFGLQRIDSIKEGDYVLSKDVETGKISYNKVDRVYIKSSDVFYNLKTNNTENIRVTGSHLFFTNSGWWIAAEHLKANDQIMTTQGTYEVVESIEAEELDDYELIYNLNVQNDHTYFVGTGGLLVHNDCTEVMTAIFKRSVNEAEEIGISSSDELAKIGQNAADAARNGRKFTEPTLPHGGTPKGSYEVATGDAETIRSITRQNEAADLFADKGYDLEMLPYKNDGNGYGIKPTSNPDYMIDGKVFDCYAPKTSNTRTIWDTVVGKTENQARCVVLNLDDYSGSLDDLVKQFNEWSIPDLDELLALRNGKIARLLIK